MKPNLKEMLAEQRRYREVCLNIARQCRATATSDLAQRMSVDGGNGTLAELLNDAADAIEFSSHERKQNA